MLGPEGAGAGSACGTGCRREGPDRAGVCGRPPRPQRFAASVRSAAALRASGPSRAAGSGPGWRLLVAGVVAALVWALFFSALITVRNRERGRHLAVDPAEVTAVARVAPGRLGGVAGHPRGGRPHPLAARGGISQGGTAPAAHRALCDHRTHPGTGAGHGFRTAVGGRLRGGLRRRPRTPMLRVCRWVRHRAVDVAAEAPWYRSPRCWPRCPRQWRPMPRWCARTQPMPCRWKLTDGRLVIWGDDTRQEFKAQVLSVLIPPQGPGLRREHARGPGDHSLTTPLTARQVFAARHAPDVLGAAPAGL